MLHFRPRSLPSNCWGLPIQLDSSTGKLIFDHHQVGFNKIRSPKPCGINSQPSFHRLSFEVCQTHVLANWVSRICLGFFFFVASEGEQNGNPETLKCRKMSSQVVSLIKHLAFYLLPSFVSVQSCLLSQVVSLFWIHFVAVTIVVRSHS